MARLDDDIMGYESAFPGTPQAEWDKQLNDGERIAKEVKEEVERLRAKMATTRGAIDLVNRFIEDDHTEMLEDIFCMAAENLKDEAEVGRHLVAIVTRQLEEMARTIVNRRIR